MARWLDPLCGALFFLILAMLITGGGTLAFTRARLQIEFSSLDPWVLALLCLLGLRTRFFPGRSAVWVRLDRICGFFTDPARGARRTGALFAVMVSALGLAHLLKHWSFETDAFDQLFLHQPIFDPGFRCDLCPAGTYLGSHLAYGLLLLKPLIWVRRDAWVFFLQALIPSLAVGAAFAGRFRRESWNSLAFLAAFPLLAARSFRGGMIWDFREDILAFACLMLAGTALSRRKLAPFLALLALAVLCKENVALVTFFFIFPILGDRALALSPRARAGLATAVAIGSIAYAALAFTVLLPHYAPALAKTSDIAGRMKDFGETPAEVLRTILFSPAAWWKLVSTRLFTADRLKYLVLLIGPFVPLFRRVSWPWLMLALPAIAMNLASSMTTQRSLAFHYDWIALPGLLLGAWKGLAATGRFRFAPAVSLLVILLFSGRWPASAITRAWPTGPQLSENTYLADLLARLPEGTRLGGDSKLLAHAACAEQVRTVELLRAPGTPAVGGGATTMLVDSGIDWEKEAASRLQSRGWRRFSAGPGNRIQAWQSPTAADLGLPGSR